MSGWSWQRKGTQFRRWAVNTALQIGGQASPLLAGAVAMPVIYTRLAPTDFGIFTLSLSILGMFALLDLGLGRATVHFLARAFAERDSAGAASVVVHSATLLGGFGISIGAILVAFVPAIAAHWAKSGAIEQATVRQTLYILIAALPFAGFTAVVRSILEAREKFPAISAIQVGFGTFTYIAPLALAFVTADVRIIVAGAVAARIVGCFAFALTAFNAWGLPFRWRAVALNPHGEFGRFSLWLVVSNIVGAAVVYGDRAMLMKLFPLADIAFYNVPLEMLMRSMLIINAAATVIFPALSRSADNKVLFERLYIAATTLLAALMGLALLALTLAVPAGLDVWLGHQFSTRSTGIVRILICGLLFQGLISVVLLSLNARRVSRPVALVLILEAPFYFAAMYWSGLHLGLIGVAIVWSGRSMFEYVCYVAFQTSVGSRGAIRRQIGGAALAASNGASLAIMAVSGTAALAIGVGLSCAVASVAWSLLQLRKTSVVAAPSI